ncbi:phage tail protein [Streptomyces uncialis]|uniref:phage tail protein n=1 Tax=Streptomyces uncialis TaxID=1048205 RepID=UPI002253C40B|nr:phage tail protein [Streptomyces uncialis]MCX4661506.1 phage tail protein [Streptomyces uncialis]
MLPLPAAVVRGLAVARRPSRAEWSNDGGRSWTPARVGAGEVRPDRTAECRYSASAELLDVPLGRHGINTVATRVRLWQGIAVPRVDTVWVPAGSYVVDQADRTRHGASLSLLGLEDVIRTARFPTPRVIGPDTARGVLPELIAEALPGATVSWRDGVDGTTVIPRFVAEEDRWAAVSGGTDGSGAGTGIASAIGGEVFADARGIITVAPVPRTDDPVVWRVGYDQAVVEAAERQSAEGLVNCWLISGDGGDGQPAVGPVAVWDDDPASLTYAGPDPVGDPGAPARLGLTHVRPRVQRYTSPLIASRAQAELVGTARLADSLGIQSSLSLTTVCHPGLEPGDLVEVEVEPGRWERHIIDACPYTLGGATQACTTRTSTRKVR